ncbi:DUF2283 domain-containing protein [Candidatus Woesearchaeota archaeon]|nr:DUF2283 domain-containing protein [Candidatus Woesearchaeota archaeon]
MKGNMNIYYDKEADFLEINIGDYTEGYFRDLGEGISERIDEKTGKVTGIAIMSFKKRTEKLKDLKIALPIKIEILS